VAAARQTAHLTAVLYVYGIVPQSPASPPPAGIDGAAVRVEPLGDLAALVSTLPPSLGDPKTIETRVGDVEWLAPRAVAHDAVVTWAGDRGAVVPFPMWVLVNELRSLEPRLAEFHAALARVAAAREYGVRVFRLDEAMAGSLGTLSPEVAELQRSAERATPGQRYLIERKLEAERKAAVRRVGQMVGEAVYRALREVAEDGTSEPLPQAEKGQKSAAVLNAAFLVREDALDGFRTTLTNLIEQYQPLGFRFEFTGPWPPYHFVGGR
jgi:Gas vesicle synthesis protein GvpL/GvpF